MVLFEFLFSTNKCIYQSKQNKTILSHIKSYHKISYPSNLLFYNFNNENQKKAATSAMERTKRNPNTSIMRSTSDSLLKRTSSSVNVAVAKSDLYLKDAKNFGTSDIPFSENETIEVTTK